MSNRLKPSEPAKLTQYGNVQFTLTITPDIYRRLQDYLKKSGTLKVQDAIRLFTITGLDRAGH